MYQGTRKKRGCKSFDLALDTMCIERIRIDQRNLNLTPNSLNMLEGEVREMEKDEVDKVIHQQDVKILNRIENQ